MNEIKLLDKDTIDKIAAGEVVERPSSVVKELLENAIDSGANAVSVEIKNGGIDLIRVTDNGSGIAKDQLKKAVLRHSTSKISNVSDLSCISTLGFRGEALSSICAVSRLEILTKTRDLMLGAIYKIEGGREISLEDAGLPDGTTVVVRDLFYNVPARLKFLKSAKTEAGYVSETVEKIALSHPEISFKFISNNSVKLITNGKNSLKDAVFCVFGREISNNLLEINEKDDLVKISGFVGKPEIARSTRALENFFINGRFVRDKVISKALEDAFKGYQMKGTFPFACFNIIIEPDLVDVNVHPAKLEVKFFDSERVYESVYKIISDVIKNRENIPEFTVDAQTRSQKDVPEFSKILKTWKADYESTSLFEDANGPEDKPDSDGNEDSEDLRSSYIKANAPEPFETERIKSLQIISDFEAEYKADKENIEQSSIFDSRFLSEEARPDIKIIGQIFETYWICEYDNKMYIIDQHAAHEKVLYEKFMGMIENNEISSQMIIPPIIVTLSSLEEITLNKYLEFFNKTGFEIEHFGGADYAITAVPSSLYSSIDSKSLFLDSLDELTSLGSSNRPEILLDRVATAACKAAVKGNNKLSFKEADELIKSLLSLENPYNCPHGRPTIITMSKYELEKKFKRII